MKAGDQETVLIGKVTAGLSHELMNVLAIIRERAGVIEDLMALEKKRRSLSVNSWTRPW
jgi:hypothetical protein